MRHATCDSIRTWEREGNRVPFSLISAFVQIFIHRNEFLRPTLNKRTYIYPFSIQKEQNNITEKGFTLSYRTKFNNND